MAFVSSTKETGATRDGHSLDVALGRHDPASCPTRATALGENPQDLVVASARTSQITTVVHIGRLLLRRGEQFQYEVGQFVCLGEDQGPDLFEDLAPDASGGLLGDLGTGLEGSELSPVGRERGLGCFLIGSLLAWSRNGGHLSRPREARTRRIKKRGRDALQQSVMGTLR